jgi:hypothetical protein
MSINFNTDDSIVLDGVATGLRYMQEPDVTVIYSVGPGGVNYRKYDMPHPRYSLPDYAMGPRHARPEQAAKCPTAAGRSQFEADLRALVRSRAS